MEKESWLLEPSKNILKELLDKNKMQLDYWHLEDDKFHTFVLTEPLFSSSDQTALSIANKIAEKYGRHGVNLISRNTARDGETPDHRYFFAIRMDKMNEERTAIPILAEARKAFESSMNALADLAVKKRKE
jgi:hypothetical protein